MTGNDADLEFPNCCGCCPHLQEFKGSCQYELRQSLIQELTRNQPCPVYSREKTSAMQRLMYDQ